MTCKRPLHARLRTITGDMRSCEITKQRNMKVAKASKKRKRAPVDKSQYRNMCREQITKGKSAF